MWRAIRAYLLYTWGGLHRYFGNLNSIPREHERAVHYFTRAYQVNPAMHEAVFARAVILWREMDRLDDALADLLARLHGDELPVVVGFLIAAPRQGRIGVGWRTVGAIDVAGADVPTLTVGDLDRTVAWYLPELATPEKAEITVRMLLTHSGGFEAFARLFDTHRGREEYLTSIASRPLAYAPGSDTVYSDWDLILLQMVIERITGDSLDRFVAGRIFEPLGMRDTMFRPPAALTPNRASRRGSRRRRQMRRAGVCCTVWCTIRTRGPWGAWRGMRGCSPPLVISRFSRRCC